MIESVDQIEAQARASYERSLARRHQPRHLSLGDWVGRALIVAFIVVAGWALVAFAGVLVSGGHGPL